MATHDDYVRARNLAMKLRPRAARGDAEAARVVNEISDLLGRTPDAAGRDQTVLLGLMKLAEEMLGPEGSRS